MTKNQCFNSFLLVVAWCTSG